MWWARSGLNRRPTGCEASSSRWSVATQRVSYPVHGGCLSPEVDLPLGCHPGATLIRPCTAALRSSSSSRGSSRKRLRRADPVSSARTSRRMTTNLWSACRPCCCEDLAQLECLVSVWWRQCLFGRIWASGVVLGVLHPRVRAASRTGRMMWSWTCSCCTSVGALTGRSRRGGFVPPWPASDAVARSTMCWWRHSRTPSGWASSDRPRSLSTATTRSRVAGSSRRWHVGSSRPLTAERISYRGAVRGGAVVKRVVGLAVGLYLTAAVVGHARERMGLISCACAEDCCGDRGSVCSGGSFPVGTRALGREDRSRRLSPEPLPFERQ